MKCDYCSTELTIVCPHCGQRPLSDPADQIRQMNRNVQFLTDLFDQLHDIVCTGKTGTWQQRVEEVVKEVKEMAEEKYSKVYPRDENGFYFWDETKTRPHGPFETVTEAHQAFVKYYEALEKEVTK